MPSAFEIELVDDHQVRPVRELSREALDLAADRLQVGPRIRPGAVDDIRENLRALDVPKEAQAETRAVRGAFDQPGDVGEHEPLVPRRHHTQLGVKGRERIVGDLGRGRSQRSEQR